MENIKAVVSLGHEALGVTTMDQKKVVCAVIKGERLDTGTPAGYLSAIIRYAYENPEYRKVILEEVKRLEGKKK